MKKVNKKTAQKGLAPVLVMLLVGLAIAGAVFVLKGNLKPGSSAPSKYSGFDDKISIQAPSGWQLKESTDAGTQASFLAPKEGANDKFIENVNLHVSDLSAKPNVTLEEVANAWSQTGKTDYPDSYAVISQENTTLAGVNAIKIIAKARDKVSDLKSMTIIILKDGKAYIFNYSAEEKSFDKFLPDVEKLLASVKLEAQNLDLVEYKNDQYGYAFKHPKGWVITDRSGETKREVLIAHPKNLANALIASVKDDSLKDKSSMEKAIAARKEFHLSGLGFKMTNFKSQVEDKKGGWIMIGEKTIDGNQWSVMERGLIDIYGKVLLQQSGYLLDGGQAYKDIVVQILDSFRVE